MDEREFELVNIIGAELGSNQRDLSKLMDLSLGMTNMLIRRLLSKGYVRIQQLNKKKVAYILTPKGMAEKMRQSVRYTLKTINSISLVKKNIMALLTGLYKDGVRKFYILGGSDLAGLIEMAVQDNFKADSEAIRIAEIAPACSDGVVLICLEDFVVDAASGIRAVNVIETLAKDETLLEHSVSTPVEVTQVLS